MFALQTNNNQSPFAAAYHHPPAASPFWAQGPQVQQSSWGNMAAFGGTLAGITALGFVPMGERRLWDYYLKAIRGVEEISPMKILRTFQWSEVTSPLGANKALSLSPELFTRTIETAEGVRKIPNMRMRELMARMTGTSITDLQASGAFAEGLEFRRTGWLFGEIATPSGRVLSSSALPMQIRPRSGASFMDWFARTSGMELGHTQSVLRGEELISAAVTTPKVSQILGYPLSEQASRFLSKARTLARYQRAYWAGQVGRLNRLLLAPLDILRSGGNRFPRLTKAYERFGKALAVKPGTATQMLWRYTAKGMGIYAGYEGLKYLSYLRSKSENRAVTGTAGAAIGAAVGRLLSKRRGLAAGAILGGIIGVAPLFDQGIFQGFAEGWRKSTTGYAKVSEAAGLTQAAREQEELMPGITKARTLAGFTLGGTMMGLFTGGLLGRFLKKEGLAGKSAKWGGYVGAAVWGAFALSAALATGHAPGILAAKHTPEELEEIHSGRKLLPVRRGRWWLFGRSAYEGSRAMMYKPHWYHLMMTRAREKALYGSEEEKWKYSPMLHPFKALFDDEFKYHWERKHYEEYPYPVTSPWGAEIPFIGPAVAATIGRVIKPQRTMHEEQWRGTSPAGESTYLQIPTAGEELAATELGGTLPGEPVSQLGAKQTIGELIYRANELRGLTGFMHGAIKEALTGSQDYFDQSQQLETAARIMSSERAYWEKELGDPFGGTELFRRFLPHRRRQVSLYNPIRNRLPDWLPGENYFIDFLHGSPLGKVYNAEWRLPGVGYEALNPDVAGVSPEDYSVYHRFKILSDVAMWSDEFKEARRQVRTAIKRGELSEDQLANFHEINRQISEKKKRKRFTEYQFSEDALQQMKVRVKESIAPGTFATEQHGVIGLSGVEMAHNLLAQKNKATIGTPTYRRKQALVSDYLREHIYPGAELDVYVHRDELHRFKKGPAGYYQPAAVMAGGTNIGRGLVEAGLAEYPEEPTPFTIATKYSGAERALGRAWEVVAHTEPPSEYLIPFSPMAKFVHQRSAVEEYERTRAYGTESAFWQHPVAHFLKPTYWMARRGLGTEELPPDVQRRMEIETYFDRLKWVKSYALEQAAKKMKDDEAAEEFRKEKRRTLFGVDPYGSLSYIYSAVPALDRDYFQEFKNAQSQEERDKILKMIPPDQRPIYQAQWNMKLATALRAQQAMGMEDESSDSLMKSLNLARMAEGQPVSPELLEQYKEEKGKGESYADWGRKQAIRAYFKKHPLPGPDWVGFHPNVDLEDLKLKMADNEALEIHDFNLWPNRRRELVRKPYVDEAYDQMMQSESLPSTPSEMTQGLETVLRNALSLENVHVQAYPVQADDNIIEIEIDDNRRDAIDMYKKDNNFMAML